MTTDGIYLIEPDRHFPFECKKFTRLVYKMVGVLQPVGYIALMDMLDFWQLSLYDKDPSRKDNVADDLELANDHFNNIESLMPKGSVVHATEGNHEFRLRRYMWRNARDASSITPLIQNLLHFPERNLRGKCRFVWHPLERWNSLRIGNTVIHHGHYFDKATAVSNLGRYPGCNFIQGHTHRVQYAHDGRFFSATLGHGALPEKSSHTPAPNTHQQALGVLTVIGGKGSLEILPVTHGRTVFRGKIIEG